MHYSDSVTWAKVKLLNCKNICNVAGWLKCWVEKILPMNWGEREFLIQNQIKTTPTYLQLSQSPSSQFHPLNVLEWETCTKACLLNELLYWCRLYSLRCIITCLSYELCRNLSNILLFRLSLSAPHTLSCYFWTIPGHWIPTTWKLELNNCHICQIILVYV